jgi:hypothetical protein
MKPLPRLNIVPNTPSLTPTAGRIIKNMLANASREYMDGANRYKDRFVSTRCREADNPEQMRLRARVELFNHSQANLNRFYKERFRQRWPEYQRRPYEQLLSLERKLATDLCRELPSLSETSFDTDHIFRGSLMRRLRVRLRPDSSWSVLDMGQGIRERCLKISGGHSFDGNKVYAFFTDSISLAANHGKNGVGSDPYWRGYGHARLDAVIIAVPREAVKDLIQMRGNFKSGQTLELSLDNHDLATIPGVRLFRP